jgi:nucleotidyltransferase substrate binding protein (TIGR01987 family)
MIKHEYQESVDILAGVLVRLNQILNENTIDRSIVIDATIRRFMYSIDLFIKALKKKLFYDHGIEVQSPKTVLQQAYVNQLIFDETIWLAMLKDRNLTSHTYNQELALEIYHRIQKYYPFLKQEFDRIFKD